MADEKNDSTSVGWPSVEKQLGEARAPAGSALEALIRNNQDFHLLQPEEAHDNFDIPPWLRVHWRKQHPEEAHPTKNPGAAYPEALEAILRWMIGHPDLPSRSDAGLVATEGGLVATEGGMQ
jgi:hypothetical protein